MHAECSQLLKAKAASQCSRGGEGGREGCVQHVVQHCLNCHPPCLSVHHAHARRLSCPHCPLKVTVRRSWEVHGMPMSDKKSICLTSATTSHKNMCSVAHAAEPPCLPATPYHVTPTPCYTACMHMCEVAVVQQSCLKAMSVLLRHASRYPEPARTSVLGTERVAIIAVFSRGHQNMRAGIHPTNRGVLRIAKRWLRCQPMPQAKTSYDLPPRAAF